MSSRPNLTLSTPDPPLDSLGLLSWWLSSLRNTRPTSRPETGAQHISWSQGRSISRSPLRRPWQSTGAFFISSLSIFFSDVVHYSGTECSFYLLFHTSVPPEFRPWQGVTVIDQSVDWNASFTNRAWSILWAAAYQASRSVSAGRLKGMVAIWLWTFNLSLWRNLTTKVRESVYPASEARIRKLSK